MPTVMNTMNTNKDYFCFIDRRVETDLCVWRARLYIIRNEETGDYSVHSYTFACTDAYRRC